MVTSIQLNENVKELLDKMKTGKETYEEVILNMWKTLEKERRKRKELLIEGCKEMYKDNLKIAKEWEGTLMDGLEREGKWWE